MLQDTQNQKPDNEKAKMLSEKINVLLEQVTVKTYDVSQKVSISDLCLHFNITHSHLYTSTSIFQVTKKVKFLNCFLNQ